MPIETGTDAGQLFAAIEAPKEQLAVLKARIEELVAAHGGKVLQLFVRDSEPDIEGGTEAGSKREVTGPTYEEAQEIMKHIQYGSLIDDDGPADSR